MEPTQDNTEKPSEIYVERDVLGLEKPTVTPTTKAYSSKIFIVLAIVIVGIAVACFLMTQRA